MASVSLSPSELIAAVDMGSNSFRLVIARVDKTHSKNQVYVIDNLREPVRLGAGLTSNNKLDNASQTRAIECLARFKERLLEFNPHQVRAVATNAVRVAVNASEFIEKAEAALGFSIDVVSGSEEARLIYCGVAHQLPANSENRLVVDIGGGSTELIIGNNYTPIALESIPIGCINLGQRFFPNGKLSEQALKEAILFARQHVVILQRQFTKIGWTHCIASSGSSRTLAEICIKNGWSQDGISLTGLTQLHHKLRQINNINELELPGTKLDRKANIPGGLTLMLAVFEELGLTQMQTSEAALRQGLLYDLIGRTSTFDLRQQTVNHFIRRYEVDIEHVQRVQQLTLSLYDQLTQQLHSLDTNRHLLSWAALLHEIGLTVSHQGHHKHAAYLIQHSDMPGFSRREQNLIADWVLAHTGKLGKSAHLSQSEQIWIPAMCLRLAALFLRRRQAEQIPTIEIHYSANQLTLSLNPNWLKNHPLTDYNLNQEVLIWQRLNLNLQITTKPPIN